MSNPSCDLGILCIFLFGMLSSCSLTTDLMLGRTFDIALGQKCVLPPAAFKGDFPEGRFVHNRVRRAWIVQGDHGLYPLQTLVGEIETHRCILVTITNRHHFL